MNEIEMVVATNVWYIDGNERMRREEEEKRVKRKGWVGGRGQRYIVSQTGKYTSLYLAKVKDT